MRVSPHFGNCYTEYDITSSNDSIRMRTSTDGGPTWGAALAPSGSHTGLRATENLAHPKATTSDR